MSFLDTVKREAGKQCYNFFMPPRPTEEKNPGKASAENDHSRQLIAELQAIATDYYPYPLTAAEKTLLNQALTDQDPAVFQYALATICQGLSYEGTSTGGEEEEEISAATGMTPSAAYGQRRAEMISILGHHQQRWSDLMLNQPATRLRAAHAFPISGLSYILLREQKEHQEVTPMLLDLLKSWAALPQPVDAATLKNVSMLLAWYFTSDQPYLMPIARKCMAVLDKINLADEPGIAQDLIPLCLLPNSHVATAAIDAINRRAQTKFGFSAAEAKEVWEAWIDSGGDNRDRLIKNLNKDISQQEQLEQQYSGSIKLLHDECGINCVGRYPLSIMEEQIERLHNIEKKTRPAPQVRGLYLSPYDDENGAFYQNPWLEELRPSDLPPIVGEDKVSITVLEYSRPLAVLHQMEEMVKRFGKFHFAVLGGHGLQTETTFRTEPQGILSRYLLNAFQRRDSVYARRLQACFVDHPIIIMNSCSTGQQSPDVWSLAGHFSHMGATVIGPDDVGSMHSLGISYNSRDSQFNVDPAYYDEDSNPGLAAQVYVNGQYQGANKGASMSILKDPLMIK
jgi:hypothetical protein